MRHYKSYQQILCDFVLNTNEHFNKCQPKDVISYESGKLISISKIKEVIQRAFSNSGIDAIKTYISSNSEFENGHCLFLQGNSCEILRAGSSGWQKGKLKINVTLEFIPDEPEEKSPLDEVRQELKQNNS